MQNTPTYFLAEIIEVGKIDKNKKKAPYTNDDVQGYIHLCFLKCACSSLIFSS